MSDDNGSRGRVPRNQAVLGDITNIFGKRVLTSDSEKIEVENKMGRYQVTQRTGSRVADFERKLDEFVEGFTAGKVNKGAALEMCDNVVDRKGKGVSFDDAKQPCESVNLYAGVGTNQKNVRLDISNMPSGSVHVQGDRAKELSLDLKEGCQEDHKSDNTDSGRHTVEAEIDHDKSSASNLSNLDVVALKENNADGGECLTEDRSHKSGLLGCLKPYGSLDFKMANMEGLLNATAASNIGSSIHDEGSMGSEKSCNCSFCLKAAYMWTDLHYQDTRGRLAALKKSKRLARSLEARCYGHDYASKTARDNSKRSTEMEFELTQHWRSLFLHTENVLVRETAHLHSALLRLKELRENSKRDLEMASMVPSEKR